MRAAATHCIIESTTFSREVRRLGRSACPWGVLASTSYNTGLSPSPRKSGGTPGGGGAYREQDLIAWDSLHCA
jgi:hypothetical protein